MTQPFSIQPDTKLERDVWNELTWAARVKAEELHVDVNHGVVTLTGIVDDAEARRAAQEAVHRVNGVRDVVNEIRVKSDPPDEGIVCFECGELIHSIEERGLAVAESIVLCERCCEQH